MSGTAAPFHVMSHNGEMRTSGDAPHDDVYGNRGEGQSLRGGEIALLFLPIFTVALGYGALLPILPTLLQRMHDAARDSSLPLHAGLLTGIYIGSFVLAAPIWGKITDLLGSRRVLLAGLLGYAAAMVAFGFAPGHSAWRISHGFSRELSQRDCCPPHQRQLLRVVASPIGPAIWAGSALHR